MQEYIIRVITGINRLANAVYTNLRSIHKVYMPSFSNLLAVQCPPPYGYLCSLDFVHIVEHGYIYEQMLAFYPAFPYLDLHQ